ncbi:MAG: hypothetical protein D4R83_02130 [Streptomycetaceae bacterium]|nr:MAG: hypothetical protein D4R83_02130 [Streptomycetaceae bacterium]
MQSLAILVAILFLSTLLSGPAAFGLTFLHPKSPQIEIIRKVGIGLLTMWGTLCGVQFTMAHVPFLVRLIGICSLVISLYTVKKEFGGPRKLKEK